MGKVELYKSSYKASYCITNVKKYMENTVGKWTEQERLHRGDGSRAGL